MAVRRILAVALLASACWAQEKKPSVRPPPKPIKIPEDATEIRPGLWRATDKSGQAWLYWNAPFGVVRAPEKPGDEIRPDMPKPPGDGKLSGPITVDNITVEEDGETLRFERRLPFGPQKWSRKKTELNDEERRIWRQVQAASATARKEAPPAAKPQ